MPTVNCYWNDSEGLSKQEIWCHRVEVSEEHIEENIEWSGDCQALTFLCDHLDTLYNPGRWKVEYLGQAVGVVRILVPGVTEGWVRVAPGQLIEFYGRSKIKVSDVDCGNGFVNSYTMDMYR